MFILPFPLPGAPRIKALNILLLDIFVVVVGVVVCISLSKLFVVVVEASVDDDVVVYVFNLYYFNLCEI